MSMGDGQEELNINNEEIIIEDKVSHLDESTIQKVIMNIFYTQLLIRNYSGY